MNKKQKCELSHLYAIELKVMESVRNSESHLLID